MLNCIRTAAAVAALSLASAGVWAMNKCIGPDGKVSFQDTPCAPASKSEKLRITPPPAPSEDAPAVNAKRELLKLQHANAIAEAIRMQRPEVGMTIDELNRAMGPATKVNAGNYSGVQSDQVIYERPNETWYVYTDNGRVTSIQHRPGAPIGTASTSGGRRCPTQLEIQNAITSANSISLSQREKEERWRAIRDMQDCGR